MLENPALSQYRYWREVIRYHGERTVQAMRREAFDGTRTRDVESWSLDFFRYARERGQHSLNYRLALNITGLSARHLDPGMLRPTQDEYEPVITMSIRSYGCWRPLMTLFPNGDFDLDAVPYDYYQVFPAWTFIKTGYAAGKRVWCLPVETNDHFEWLNQADYTKRRPYVPRDSFVAGCQYRLEANARGQWNFATVEPHQLPTGSLYHKQVRATELLTTGHQVVERRYERFRRAAERDIPANRRQKLALYIPKQGRVTGLEAVDEFSQHMRVFPAPKPEEAQDASNGVVTGPIHC